MFSQVTQIGSIYQIPPAIDSLQWCKIIPKGNATFNITSPDEIDFDRLLPTLFEVFAIVFCGFLAGRCNLISITDIKGLNDFTTYFTLPPLIFLNLVTINFYHVNWLFILGILLGKIVVFMLVATVTAAVQKPTNLSYAGIYGIFCTQGNDFGLAYPIVASLYGSKRPLYPGYMYLIAPTSLLFLNPLGFVLMEAQKNKNSEEKNENSQMSVTVIRTVSNVTWNIMKNPIVFVTLLGVFGNFLFRNGLPSVLFGILQILSSAFSGAVLFLLGFSVAGTGQSNYSKKEGLLIPSVLLITKMLVSPLITRSSVSLLCASAPDVEDLADYGFLYGMVPTGPIVMLFAAEYGLRTEMMASTMVLCTGLFGPVVFVLARMLSLNVKGISEFSQELRGSMLAFSILSLLSCVWIGLTLFIILAFGVLLWSVCQSNEEWIKYLEIMLISSGQLMSRVWITILAVTMVLLRRMPLSTFVRKMFWPHCIGLGFPAIIVIMILIITAIGQCEPELDKELPLFVYGAVEAVGSMVVLLICLITTTFCLVLYYRSPRGKSAEKLKTDKDIEKEDKGVLAIEIEKCVNSKSEKNLLNGTEVAIYKMKRADSVDVTSNKLEQRIQPVYSDSSNNGLTNFYGSMKRSETSFSEKHLLSSSGSEVSSPESSPKHHKQPNVMCESEKAHLRHVILLILNSVSMAVGLTISMWKLSTNQPNGLFVAMEFLDAVLIVGQGVFVFIVFIKDTKYIIAPVTKWTRKVRHGFYSLSEESIDSTIQQQSNLFCTYHRENCIKDLPRTIKKNENLYNNCFTGPEFVDWLIKVGLAGHRTAAEYYGQRLFRGGVLHSADGAVQFHDNSAYLYTLQDVTPND